MTLQHDRVSYFCGSYHYGDGVGKAAANWKEQDLNQGNQIEAAVVIQARNAIELYGSGQQETRSKRH